MKLILQGLQALVFDYASLAYGQIMAPIRPAFNEQLASQSLLGSHFGIPGIPATYDYVIVGGGTAGLVMARRLAANTSITVAVIEAGDFYEMTNGNASQVPSFTWYFLGSEPSIHNPLIDWMQVTEPQEGLGGRKIAYPQGKTFGGGSARNVMTYNRGSKGSYAKWAEAVDDPSYEWDALLPYFQRSVAFTPPGAGSKRLANTTVNYDPSSFSAKGGPLHVSFPPWANAVATWVREALNELGWPEAKSFVNGDLLGHAWVLSTIHPQKRTRESSESSFLREALRETLNLQLYKTTLAKKILFDDNKRATGVLVNSGGVEYPIFAKQEVILSAGAFRSPQLLMVSGIGPKETLDKFDIPVIVEAPGVGQNLWDHWLFSTSHAVNVTTHSRLGNPEYIGASSSEYINKREGMLTNPGGDYIAFSNVPKGLISESTAKDMAQVFGSDWPAVEHLVSDAYVGDSKDLLLGVPPTGMNYFSLLGIHIAPFSRGTVSIASRDTAVNPLVDPAWLSDARDGEIAVAIFKMNRQITNTKAMQGIVIGEEVYPGTKDVSTDEEILDYIRKTGLQVWHPSCTCKMGVKGDKMAVADSKGRVFGVQGLRVVDASAFPLLPPGHSQATVYMLAEKVSEAILLGL